MQAWGLLKRKQKTKVDAVVELYDEADLTAVADALCQKLDLPRPIILPAHERDFIQFRRVVFKPDDFIEAFAYDVLEIQNITEEE